MGSEDFSTPLMTPSPSFSETHSLIKNPHNWNLPSPQVNNNWTGYRNRIAHCGPAAARGFFRTRMTESPRRNILEMKRSLLTGLAFFLPIMRIWGEIFSHLKPILLGRLDWGQFTTEFSYQFRLVSSFWIVNKKENVVLSSGFCFYLTFDCGVTQIFRWLKLLPVLLFVFLVKIGVRRR